MSHLPPSFLYVAKTCLFGRSSLPFFAFLPVEVKMINFDADDKVVRGSPDRQSDYISLEDRGIEDETVEG